MEGLSQHLLRDADGLRAVTRAIKNILDYGSDARKNSVIRIGKKSSLKGKQWLLRGTRDMWFKLNCNPRSGGGAERHSWHLRNKRSVKTNLIFKRRKEGAIVHEGEDSANESEGNLQAKRRRHDPPPLPPSTRSGHAANKRRIGNGGGQTGYRAKDQIKCDEQPKFLLTRWFIIRRFRRTS